MSKLALITGASSGIGREMALLHAKRGGDIVAIARSKDKLQDLESEIQDRYNQKVTIIVKDLSQTKAAQEIFEEVKNQNLSVDYLINNAGFGGLGKFHERSLSDDLAMLQVNVVALTALTKFFLPEFVKRGRGRVLNVSSTASLVPGPLQAVYFASKAYVTSFSNALASELKETGVTVTALLPGATETDFAKNAHLQETSMFEHPASAAAVALAGYEAMEAGQMQTVAGVSAWQRLLLTFLPLTPKRVAMNMVKKMQDSSPSQQYKV